MNSCEKALEGKSKGRAMKKVKNLESLRKKSTGDVLKEHY